MFKSQIKPLSKKLVELSLNPEGFVCHTQVKAVLSAINLSSIHNKKVMITAYFNAIKKRLAESNAILEHANTIPAETIQNIQSFITHHYQRPIQLQLVHNASLIAGFRISISNDIWEKSLANTLNKLANHS